ncbi:hypothetical protein [Kribbella sp. CA-294648]|uniref:hypothetical protein n=1 Tax=Kribbella sp. CA-294648 TaxID=3239948 RepID=UPI003D94C63D
MAVLQTTLVRWLALLGTMLRATPARRLARLRPVTLWPGPLARILEGRLALT